MKTVAHWFSQTLPESLWHGLQYEGLRYVIGTIGMFVVVWILLEPYVRHRRIRTPRNVRDVSNLPGLKRGGISKRQIKTELLYSLSTICVFIALDIVVFDFVPKGVFKKYHDISDYGLPYFIISLPLAFIIHDTYYYWAHRMMHHPKIYKYVHAIHHRSFHPTPFSAYCFAPLEAIVMYAFAPLCLLVLPMHNSMIISFVLLMMFKNTLGHCGYELYPRFMKRNRFLQQFNTVTHHDLHHENGRRNFGLYFTWWDRWMGTEHEDYHARFAAVIAKRPSDAFNTKSIKKVNI